MTATKDPTQHNPPPDDALPVDPSVVRGAVERALVQGPVPRHADLVELEGLLLGYVRALLPLAEKTVDGLRRGSVDWYDKRATLDVARSRLSEGMGPGLVSAHTHVRQLAYSCRALLRYAEAAGR